MRRGQLYALAALGGALALGSAWMGVHSAALARSASAAPSFPAAAARAAPKATTTPDTYYVEKVVDGDTLDIYKDGETVRLRLLGMDTPEVVDPRKPVQCFGRTASAEGHTLLDEQWVRLEYDSAAGTYDKYGRTLAYVFRASDGLFYNLFMIRYGYAHEYDYDNEAYRYRAQFKAAQTAAKTAGFGFWSPSTCGGNTTKAATPGGP